MKRRPTIRWDPSRSCPGKLLSLVLLVAGCNETPTKQPQSAEPSPNASILPAPLSSELEPVPQGPLAEAGVGGTAPTDVEQVAPEPLRADQALDPDVVSREAASERWIAEIRWLSLPSFPRLPELNGDAIERIRDGLGFLLEIDLSAAGRLRAVINSKTFALPEGTELRSREDRLGHLLLWNSAENYAVLAPGTLRAVLNERRADAAPVTKPKLTNLGSGSALGLATDKLEVTTPLGRLILEQTPQHGVGAAATLLCRMLLELLAADPQTPACSRRELPLRAELFSAGGGHLLFELKRRVRDPEIPLPIFRVPPGEARLAIGEMPPLGSMNLLTREQLGSLRGRPAARSEKPDPSAPKEGLLIENHTEELRFVLLDGLILARMPPHTSLLVDALIPGKYALSSQDFLGDDPTPVRIVELPALLQLGTSIEPER